MKFQNKKAIVAGGNWSIIEQAIAIDLAKAGAKVFCSDEEGATPWTLWKAAITLTEIKNKSSFEAKTQLAIISSLM